MILLTNLWVFFKFHQLSYSCPFSEPGCSSGCHIAFSHDSSLLAFNLEQCLSLPLTSVTLTLLKSTGQLFCRLSLCLVLADFPYDSMQVRPFWQENHRMPYSVVPPLGRRMRSMVSLPFTLITWLWWCLHVKVLFFLFSLISLSGGLGIFFRSPQVILVCVQS